jgi:hypothetical protein
MTTIRQIVIDAYGEAGIIGLDDVPDAAQLEVGVRRINTIIKSLFGNELGEQLLPVNFGKAGSMNTYGQGLDQSSYIASKYVPANSRLILNLASSYTIYLNPSPDDGARFGVVDISGNLSTNNLTVNANGTHIESTSSVTLNTNSLNRMWFYRQDQGNWARVTDLDESDESPLPEEFDDLLSTMLALRLNPRFGAETSNEMTQVLQRMRTQFRARYHQTKEVSSETGLYWLPSTYGNFYWSQDDFDSGRPVFWK